jgi:hypothetical protein
MHAFVGRTVTSANTSMFSTQPRPPDGKEQARAAFGA